MKPEFNAGDIVWLNGFYKGYRGVLTDRETKSEEYWESGLYHYHSWFVFTAKIITDGLLKDKEIQLSYGHLLEANYNEIITYEEITKKFLWFKWGAKKRIIEYTKKQLP